MGSSLNFYIKDYCKENNTYIYFCSIYRDSYIYATFKVIKGDNTDEGSKALIVTSEDINKIINKLEEHKEVVQKSITRLNKEEKCILKMNNSAEEKHNLIWANHNEVELEQEELEELDKSISFYEVLDSVNSYDNERLYGGIGAISPNRINKDE